MSGEPEIITFLVDALASRCRVVVQRMFGGYGIYANGKMFAIADDEVLYFKVDAHHTNQYRDLESEPFCYQRGGKRVVLSYWRVPEEVLNSPSMLVQWALESISIAQRDSAKKSSSRQKKAVLKNRQNHATKIQDQNLRNLGGLGECSVQWLKEIGITTEDQLRKRGAVSVYRELKELKPRKVSTNLLWALHAALTGQRWNQLNDRTKQKLIKEVGSIVGESKDAEKNGSKSSTRSTSRSLRRTGGVLVVRKKNINTR